MSIESALLYYLIVLTFVISPGPGVFAIISHALATGIYNAIFIGFAMMITDIFYLLLACYGLSEIAQRWDFVFSAVRILGTAYLIYLGCRMFLIKAEVQNGYEKIEKKKRKKIFLQGLLIGFSNPKAILFYLAFLPNFINLQGLDFTLVITIVVLTILPLLTGIIIISLGATFIKKFIQSPKGVKTLNNVSGFLMILAGIYLFFQS